MLSATSAVFGPASSLTRTQALSVFHRRSSLAKARTNFECSFIRRCVWRNVEIPSPPFSEDATGRMKTDPSPPFAVQINSYVHGIEAVNDKRADADMPAKMPPPKSHIFILFGPQTLILYQWSQLLCITHATTCQASISGNSHNLCQTARCDHFLLIDHQLGASPDQRIHAV